ncbi:MAG: HNH endonuclease [Peptostreptococcaceae bacterium]
MNDNIYELEEIFRDSEVKVRYYDNKYFVDSVEQVVYLVMIKRSTGDKTIATFDMDDFELISGRIWYPHSDKNKPKHMVYVLSAGGIRLHRLIMNPPDDMVVDHIDRNPLNNRKGNLRICTTEENNRNTSISKRNNSGLKGVHYDSERNRWVASIYFNGKTYFKRFKYFSEAALYRVYLEKMIKSSTTIPEKEVKSQANGERKA